MAPSRSQATTRLAPACTSMRVMAVPAAPTPTNTILAVANDLLTSFRALVSAACTTTAVPCLAVVHDRDVEGGAQPLLDLEAPGRGDVLQIDAAEHRRDAG